MVRLSRSTLSRCRRNARQKNHAAHSCSAGHTAGSERQLILCSPDIICRRQGADHHWCCQQRQHGCRGAERARVCWHRNALLQLFTVLQQILQHYILPLWMRSTGPLFVPLWTLYIQMPTQRMQFRICTMVLPDWLAGSAFLPAPCLELQVEQWPCHQQGRRVHSESSGSK